jgi:hypothetical protein
MHRSALRLRSHLLRAALVCAMSAAATAASAQSAMDLLDGPRAGKPIHIRASSNDAPAEVTIDAPKGAWDLSAFDSVTMTAHNGSGDPLTVRARVENDGATGLTDNCRGAVVLLPGDRKELRVRLVRRPEDPGYGVFKPFMMYFKAINVRDNTIDPAAVTRIVVGFDAGKPKQSVNVTGVRAVGNGVPAPMPFFPFVDGFGQYVHSEWPGKIHAADDFTQRRAEEVEERKDWPGPKDWDQYGGWAKGPQLEKTGFFHAKKHGGKWWMVDPDGRLFWSYGPTGVGFGGDVTPITDREHWFRDLPSRDDPVFGGFYREGQNATYQYYQKRKWLGFDVAAANLVRKYGPNYKDAVADLSHDRIRSWGYNTLGNWSAPEVYLRKRTPYTVAVHYGSPLIHYRMPDVYHPDWEPAVRAAMEKQRDTTAGDPWNIGYFVDNERWWGWRVRGAAIGEEVLKNPADAPAKLKFVEMLRAKYRSIGSLNKAWGTSHASFDALLEHREAPDMENTIVLADCGDYGMMFAERYFTIVRDAVKAVAPNNMYLGVRFHGHVDVEIVKLAGTYADVISYNIYDNPPDGRVNQYAELDLPILSTEWGVGSDLQQTPFRGDDTEPSRPEDRIEKMVQYAEIAIRHPNMIGAHFFQYRDQPLSGRPDGEATLRGFVNIADTPNFELVQANRRLGYNLYRMRAEAK